MERNKVRLERVEEISINKSICSPEAYSSEFLGQATALFTPGYAPLASEAHHASHVLTFYSYMAYNSKLGKGVSSHLLERIIHHLSALREFVEESGLSELVAMLYTSTRNEHKRFPRNGEQHCQLVRSWLGKNQEAILRLAEHYHKKEVFDGLLPMPVSVGINKSEGTAIHDRRDRYLVEEEQSLRRLFVGYFNSKMAVLVFLIQAQRHRPEKAAILGMRYFLDDLFNHLLDSSKQVRCRRVFLWLKRFLGKLPNVRLDQRRRAVRFIQDLYDVFGVQINSNLREDKNENSKEGI